MSDIPLEFYAASVAAGRPAAMQAECGGSLSSLKWTTLGWGECGGWGSLSARAPAVAAYRWLQPRRMTNICRRNDHDRNDALQTAWSNAFLLSRSTPTANAEDPRRSEGAERRISPETFPTPTPGSIYPLGVHRRRVPKIFQE